MARTTHSKWYHFPYVLGLLPIVVLVLIFVSMVLSDGAIPTMRGMVGQEVVRSMAVTYASPTMSSPGPGDSTRSGMVLGTIQSEKDRRDIQTHGVFVDCRTSCLAVSPSDERVKKYAFGLDSLLDPHTEAQPEHKRLARSATHDDARCYIKYTTSKTLPQEADSSSVACLSFSTGAYVYMLWHV